jgi:hypothetical protein
VNLPPRAKIVSELESALAAQGLKSASVDLHYLSSGLDIEVTLQPSRLDALENEALKLARVDLDALRQTLGARKLSVTHAVDVSAAGAELVREPRGDA